jgi:hypothetical protein
MEGVVNKDENSAFLYNIILSHKDMASSSQKVK